MNGDALSVEGILAVSGKAADAVVVRTLYVCVCLSVCLSLSVSRYVFMSLYVSLSLCLSQIVGSVSSIDSSYSCWPSLSASRFRLCR